MSRHEDDWHIAPPRHCLACVRTEGRSCRDLFDIGVQDEQSARLDRAKLTLLTLASTYYDSPLAANAKVEIGAICIFGEAQAQRRSGQAHAAYNTLSTVTRVYPESALAKLASTETRNLDPDGKWDGKWKR